jgi:hypothetical protein
MLFAIQKNVKTNQFFTFFAGKGHFFFYHFHVMKNKKRHLASHKKMKKRMIFYMFLAGKGVFNHLSSSAPKKIK